MNEPTTNSPDLDKASLDEQRKRLAWMDFDINASMRRLGLSERYCSSVDRYRVATVRKSTTAGGVPRTIVMQGTPSEALRFYVCLYRDSRDLTSGISKQIK